MNAKRLIGRRVADRMKEMGFNDEALSHETGLTVKTIWRLRNGKSYPRADTAKRVAAALNLTLTELQPPTSEEEDPELRDLLQDALVRLQRIENAVAADAEDRPEVDPLTEAPEVAEESIAPEPDRKQQQSS